MQVTLPVTPEVDAHARPRERGTRLALVEIALFEGDRAAAMLHVERLLAIEPDDTVVLLSFAELTLEGDADRARLERIVAQGSRQGVLTGSGYVPTVWRAAACRSV